jgi:shikimate kinase
VIGELCALEKTVLATGGGAVLAQENRRILAARGIVVYLHARTSHLWQRVRHDRNRPLLATADPQRKLDALYAERDPLYREVAHIAVDTGKQSVQTLAKDLIARLDGICSPSA